MFPVNMFVQPHREMKTRVEKNKYVWKKEKKRNYNIVAHG